MMTGPITPRKVGSQGAYAISTRYPFLGLHGHGALTPWIWSAVLMLLVAVTILMVHPLRRHPALLTLACVLTAVGVWIEKGMGMVVPGFVPTPLGEVFEYLPNLTEGSVSVGVWGIGLLVFTWLAKAGVAIECGDLRDRRVGAAERGCAAAAAPAEGR